MTDGPTAAFGRVVLIGAMGVGKSTIGAALAHRLGWRHIDLDARIERLAGRPVAEIFRLHGEPAFRRLEAEATAALVDARGVVISPGGGWVTNPALPPLLRPGSLLVWLRASTDTVLARLAAADVAARPLLDPRDPAAALDRLLREREPFYRQADRVVDVDDRTVEEIVEEIVHHLRAPGTPGYTDPPNR